MTVPYLLRFCPFRALMGILFVFIPRVSLRLPWAMRLLGFLALASGKAERSPNSIQASPFSKYYYKTLINKPI